MNNCLRPNLPSRFEAPNQNTPQSSYNNNIRKPPPPTSSSCPPQKSPSIPPSVDWDKNERNIFTTLGVDSTKESSADVSSTKSFPLSGGVSRTSISSGTELYENKPSVQSDNNLKEKPDGGKNSSDLVVSVRNNDKTMVKLNNNQSLSMEKESSNSSDTNNLMDNSLIEEVKFTSTEIVENSKILESNDDGDSCSENSSSVTGKDKTPMCLINDLARYNKMKHQYCLTDEKVGIQCHVNYGDRTIRSRKK